MTESRGNYRYHIAFAAAVAFLWALYALRAYDDNTLTSWRWSFMVADIADVTVYAIIGLIAARLLVAYPFYERRPAAFLFVLSYAYSMLFWPEPEVIVDTSRYFTAAKQLMLGGVGYFIREWGHGIWAWTDMPLMPFVYGILFKVFGEHRVVIQAVNSLVFSGTVLVTYYTGRELWDEETGFLGGLMLLGVPYLLTQVPLMLVDVPAMFFLTLSIYTFIKALKNGGKGWTALASVAIFLAFYSKYSTWLMLTVLAPVAAVHLGNEPKRAIRRAAVVLAAAGAMIAVVLVLKHDVIFEQMKLLVQYQRPGLRRWGESFFSTFFFQTHPFVTLGALLSVGVALKRRDPKYIVALWCVAIVFIFDIRRIRYVLMVFPMLTLMAAYGTRALMDRGFGRFVAFGAVGVSMAVALGAFLPFINGISMVNLKDAGRFLNTLDVDKAVVYTLPQRESSGSTAVAVPILDLYTDKKIVYHGGDGPPEDIEKSSLRFTWEYRVPEFYEGDGEGEGEGEGGNAAIVVISDFPVLTPPDGTGGGELLEVFGKTDSAFRYKTVVSVFRAAPQGGGG